MSKEFEPYNTTSVDRFIEEGMDLDVSESKLAFKELIDGEIIVPFYNVITKNIDAIRSHITTYTMDDDEFQTYKYQPKLFCYEMYNTPELASSLLYINNMISITEFTKKTINIFTGDIMDIINELMSLNEDDLKQNKVDIESEE